MRAIGSGVRSSPTALGNQVLNVEEVQLQEADSFLEEVQCDGKFFIGLFEKFL